jgi:tetratricopeptide (TPR) repeat protein
MNQVVTKASGAKQAAELVGYLLVYTGPGLGFFIANAWAKPGSVLSTLVKVMGFAPLAIFLIFSALRWLHRTTSERVYTAGVCCSFGNDCFDKGLYKQAIQWYLRALEKDPANGTAYYEIGRTFEACGQSDLALEYYEKAINVDPDMTSAWNNKGKILYERGQRAAAIECLRKAEGLGSGEARFNLEKLGDN